MPLASRVCVWGGKETLSPLHGDWMGERCVVMFFLGRREKRGGKLASSFFLSRWAPAISSLKGEENGRKRYPLLPFLFLPFLPSVSLEVKTDRNSSCETIFSSVRPAAARYETHAFPDTLDFKRDGVLARESV